MSDPRPTGHPEPGFFVLRFISGGPMVAARIWRPCLCSIGGGAELPPHEWAPECDRFPALVGVIDGRRGDPHRIWESGRRVSRAEYRYFHDGAEWDRANDPDSPAANPGKAIDLMTVKPHF